jgi:hypothetical protein
VLRELEAQEAFGVVSLARHGVDVRMRTCEMGRCRRFEIPCAGFHCVMSVIGSKWTFRKHVSEIWLHPSRHGRRRDAVSGWKKLDAYSESMVSQ